MTSKKNKWRIDPTLKRRPSDKDEEPEWVWDVTRNTKAIKYGLEDEDAALAVVHKHRKYQEGDAVWIDGDRVE